MAYRFRWMLLAGGLLSVAFGLWWIVSPFMADEPDLARFMPIRLLPTSALPALFELDEDIDVGACTALFVGVLALAQWGFLRPRRGFRIGAGECARPMKFAVFSAAFMAVLLSTGFIATLAEVVSPETWWRAMDDDDLSMAAIAGISVMWLVWAAVFYVYWRGGDRFSLMRRMVRGLLVGSLLELMIAIGVYAWNPEQEDCWCARGSYTGLVFGATVMIWAFGPGLVLLFLREQERRARHG